ncbi:MAG TPA: hypothetical protein V6C89_09550 [Drouetiella sp.]
MFVLLNAICLAGYWYVLKFSKSPSITEACQTGEFNASRCLKDLPLFFWSLQNGFERTRDAKLRKLESAKHADVVLTGSSLMIFPLWFADHGNNLPDSAYYSSESKSMEDKCPHANKICNLSLALLNASDAQRLIEDQLTGDHKPSVLVYGVGPRDFYDDYIKEPADSVYFNNQARPSDFTTDWKNFFASPYTELCHLGKDAYFLYWKHDAFINAGKSIVKSVLHKDKAAPIVPLTDMGPQRNLDEYRGHYKNISVQALDAQMNSLQRLLATCSNRHIRVILLSMPLTTANQALLPAGVYQSFNEKLAAAAIASGNKFINLNGTKFDTSDFLDSAHLNAKGAHRLVDTVSKEIESALIEQKKLPE